MSTKQRNVECSGGPVGLPGIDQDEGRVRRSGEQGAGYDEQFD